MLNKYFVALEFNATEAGGVPGDVPAMEVLRKTWEESPYCRVAFRGEWVLSPDGEYLLGATACAHDAAKKVKTNLGDSFEKLVEGALARFERVRSHPRGSEAEREEIRHVHQEVLRELQEIKPCWLDKDVMTEHYIKTVLAQGDGQEAFERRYCQLFDFEEPEVRRRSIENVSVYASRAAFHFVDKLPYLSDQTALLLEDPDEGVRHAAAVALYRFRGEAVPDLDGSELVANAGQMWWKDRQRPIPEDERAFKEKLPEVWPVQHLERAGS